jgi:hypothetical protein
VVQVARPAGLGTSTRKALAAEGLHADDGADDAAVDIGVADPKAIQEVAHGLVDAAVDAEGQPVAGRGDLVNDRIEPIGLPTRETEDGPEDLSVEPIVRPARLASLLWTFGDQPAGVRSADKRICLAALTMFSSAGRTSVHFRVFSPQSGLTQI